MSVHYIHTTQHKFSSVTVQYTHILYGESIALSTHCYREMSSTMYCTHVSYKVPHV